MPRAAAKPAVSVAFADDFGRDLASVFETAYRAAGATAADLRGTQTALGNATSHAEAYARERGSTMITDIDETTLERTQDIIGRGVAGNLSDQQVSDRLATLYGDVRADLIARTEIATAFNLGTVQALKDAGEEYVYVSDPDECGEDVCDVDGQIWTLEEAEAEPIGHPNCGRDFRPLTEDELAEIRAEEAEPEAEGVGGFAALEDRIAALEQRFYSEDQPRGEDGKWTSGGDGAADGRDHRIVRDGGTWGQTHYGSRAITWAAASMMGVKGYEAPDKEDERRSERIASRFLTAIHEDRVGSEETLYHVFDNKSEAAFKVGDTFTLPLAATSGDISFPGWYSGSPTDDAREQRMTVFEFPRGTPIAGYERYVKTEDTKAIWQEALTAGRFQVTGSRRMGDWPNWRVVSVRPTETFNPVTKTWREAKTNLLAPKRSRLAAGVDLTLAVAQRFYSEDQERDEQGRWTTGGGGGRAAAPATAAERGHLPDATVTPGMRLADHHEQTEGRIRAAAALLGFPKDRLSVHWGTGPTFKVGSVTCREVAHFDPHDSTITFHTQAFIGADEHVILGCMAHEIQHAKWDEIRTAVALEIKQSYRDGARSEETDRIRIPMDRFDKAYPVSSTMAQYITSEAALTRLEKAGGVSDYSRDYWRAYREERAAGRPDPQTGERYQALFARGLAVNETLAETAYHVAGVQFGSPDSTTRRTENVNTAPLARVSGIPRPWRHAYLKSEKMFRLVSSKAYRAKMGMPPLRGWTRAKG